MDINKLIKQVKKMNETSMFDDIKSKLNSYLNSQEYNDNKKRIKQIEIERKKFVNKFNTEYIKKMKLENYITECPHREESFCYILEHGKCIEDLGSIRGSFATKKFGIHKNKKNNNDNEKEYKYLKKFGSNKDEVYKNINKYILDLLDAAERNDYDSLQNNKLAPMFKSKIYYVYYPEKSIPINDSEEIIFFLKKLGFENLNETNIFLIKKLLLRCKEILAPDISNWEFMNFLYSHYGYRTEIDDLKEIKKNRNNKNEKIDFQEITKYDGLSQQTKSTQVHNLPNYEIIQRKKTAIGMCGEELVLQYEKNNNKKYKELIKSVANTDCGYDILSFDVTGKEKHIEVKTKVSGSVNNIDFYLTANEYEKLKNDDLYVIYYVCGIKDKHKTIYSIKKHLIENALEPVLYRIKGKGSIELENNNYTIK